MPGGRGPEAPSWGYPPPAPWGHQPPPPPHHSRPPLKRSLSDQEDDDAFSEDSNKEQCSSPGEADSCQMLSRKKRRGIIEKRRRDRINCSLLELRRLVPTAFEKQGSAKLEKAEILQMTVDHLKTLQAKDENSASSGFDASKLAMDYHSIGFRECAAEVARYLVTVEGLDLQDPLRLRLMSHLQCFAAQREPKYPPPPQYTSYEYGPGGETPTNTSSSGSSSANSSANSSFETGATTSGPCEGRQAPTLTPLTPVSSYNQPHYPHPHYGPAPDHHQQGYHSPVSSQKQPYRPWGAELAY